MLHLFGQACLCNRVLKITQVPIITLYPLHKSLLFLLNRNVPLTLEHRELNRHCRKRTIFSMCAVGDTEPASPSNLKHVMEYLDSLILGT